MSGVRVPASLVFIFCFGIAMEQDQSVPTEELKQQIWGKVALVEDPEIGLSITELGLIYDIQVPEPSKALVKMTFTSMACPYGPQLKAQVHAAATRVVSDAEVEVVFSPPWDPREMASEEAKAVMGMY